MAKSIIKKQEQIKALDSLDFLWYNRTYETRFVLAKMDMHFCANAASLANFL